MATYAYSNFLGMLYRAILQERESCSKRLEAALRDKLTMTTFEPPICHENEAKKDEISLKCFAPSKSKNDESKKPNKGTAKMTLTNYTTGLVSHMSSHKGNLFIDDNTAKNEQT